MSKEVGRPSELSEELMLKIRDLVLDGKSIKDMSEILDIPYATMRYWSATNYQSFTDKLLSYKHERMLRKAETNLEVLQDSEDERVNLQANTFVLETLGKKNYAKKTETDITSGGKPIIQIASEIVEKNNLNESNTSSEGNS